MSFYVTFTYTILYRLIYFIESTKIERINYNGGGRTVIGTIIDNGRYVTLDVTGQIMYWINDVTNTLHSARFDGSGRRQILSAQTGSLQHLEILGNLLTY
jgi:hypothetical protein